MQGYAVDWPQIPLFRPSSNWHARIVWFRDGTKKSWDFNAGALATNATFANTCQSISFDSANNGHFFTPPADLPPGEYVFQAIDAAVPAVTDQPVCKLFRWDKAKAKVSWIGDL